MPRAGGLVRLRCIGALVGGLLGVASSGAFAAAPAPARLADTGLYSDFAARTIAPANLPFSPQYPLWTDGAAKRRWIHLPPGTAIDASDPDAWVFPAGTKLWKEFALGRRVETRFMELGEDGEWTYATYVWADDEREALLAPERGVRGVREIAAGVRHDIPGRYECQACHQGNLSPVLGFSALQLSPDRDPLAPHAPTPEPGALDLAALLARGQLRGLPADLVAQAPRIAAESPEERAALGYLHGNCSSCHNARGPLASLGMSLEVRLASGHLGVSGALTTAVANPSRFHGAGPDAVERIAAGDPERSVLVRRVASRNPLLQMPPLGTRVADQEAIDRLLTWIRTDLADAPQLAHHAVVPINPSHPSKESSK